MKNVINLFFLLSFFGLIGAGCKSMSKTQKGVVIGAAAGGALGAGVGKAAGNTALGAIIGATVGGVTGAVIGTKMDKQAAEIKNNVPGAKVYRVGEGIIVEFNSKILFAFDKSDVSETAKENLNKLVTVLNNYPETNIEIQGHTDSEGDPGRNLTLSEQRAGSVRAALEALGVPVADLTAKGFGLTRLVTDANGNEIPDRSRRVVFDVTVV